MVWLLMEEYATSWPNHGIFPIHMTPGQTPYSSSRKEAAGPLGVLLVALSQSKQQASLTLVPEHAWSAHSSRSLTRRGAQRPNETLPPYPHGSKISGTYVVRSIVLIECCSFNNVPIECT